MIHLHAFIPAEVVPAVPLISEAALGIAALGSFLAFVVCWGLREGWDATIGYGLRWVANEIRGVSIPTGFFGSIHPFGSLADAFEAVDKNISHALAVAALNSQHAFSWCTHECADVFWWSVHETASLARDTLHAFDRFEHGVIPRAVSLGVAHAESLAKSAEHRAERYADTKARALEHDLSVERTKIDHRVGVVESAIAHTLPRIKTIEEEIEGLEKQARAFAKRLSPAAIVALIGATIWKLLPSFFRCPSFRSAGNRLGCFGFQILDDLLAGVIDVLVVADLCRFTHLMIDLAESAPVQDALYGIVNGLDDLIDCQGVYLSAPLNGPQPTVPPLQAYPAIQAA